MARSRRTVMLVGAFIGSIALLVGAFYAGRLSGQNESLAVSVPLPAVTISVEMKTLRDVLAIRGTVSLSEPSVLLAPAPVDGSTSVVTGVFVESGANAVAGSTLIEVSTRPIFAMVGQVPMFRDLVPGLRGSDVRQVQSNLNQLGYTVPATEAEAGLLSTGTRDALTSFYADRGYDVLPTGVDDEAEADALENAVDDATLARNSADRVLGSLEDAFNAGLASTYELNAAIESFNLADAGLAQARDALELFRASTGLRIPVGELAFVDTLPAAIVAVDAEVGDETAGAAPEAADGAVGASGQSALMTLSAGGLQVTAPLSAAQASIVREGLVARLTDPTLETPIELVVSEVRSPASDDESAAELVAALPTEQIAMLDRNVGLIIERASTEAPVLVVPLIAIYSRGDGTSYVLRERGGRTEQVQVVVGLAVEGEAAVEPLVPAALVEGDDVQLGVQTDGRPDG